MKKISLFILFLLFSSFVEKEYIKLYYKNGTIKEEGWMLNQKKTDYWFFYFENGHKKEEGHYLNNQKNKWWIFYNENKKILKKCEYRNNELNGLSLIYKNDKIIKAEKFKNGIRIKTWTNLNDFKKDNPLF